MSRNIRGTGSIAGSITKFILLGGTALTFAVTAASPVSSQTRRERQLERRVQELEKELRQIKSMLTKDKFDKSVETVVKKTVPNKTPKVARSGQKNVSLEISGQVNRAVMFAWNKNADNIFFVDNDASSTRFRFTGRANIDKYWTVFARIELEAESNSSNEVNQLNKEIGFDFNERKLEFRIRRKGWFSLWVGQGDTASNAVAEKDLSGTVLAGYSDIDTFGGPRFGTPTGAGIANTPQIVQVFDNLDGNSREDRIRLDGPPLHGFLVSTSVSNDYGRDIAVEYEGEPLYQLGLTGKGELLVAGGFGWFKRQSGNNLEGLSGSITALHIPTGLNLTFAAGSEINNSTVGRDNRNYWYVKGGWQWRFFDIGKTAFSVDYAAANDVRINGEEATAIGFQIVQKVDKAGLELYLGFRHHELDSPAGQPDFGDVQILITGARVKF